MLSIAIVNCYAECQYANWHYAECHYADWHYAECHDAKNNDFKKLLFKFVFFRSPSSSMLDQSISWMTRAQLKQEFK
jgi:hypothetical protein